MFRKSLNLLITLTLIPIYFVISAPQAVAAAGSVGSGSCETTVGETTTVTVSTSGNDCIYKFTSGTNSFTVPTAVQEISLLLVGGGGGGGSRTGGGGGAGGFVYLQNVGVIPTNQMSLTVGAGGSGGSGSSSNATSQGTNGGNSTITLKSAAVASSTITAVGGGGGGSGWSGYYAGKAGGSGGGSSGTTAVTAQTQTANYYGLGKNGVIGTTGGTIGELWSGGGGGGSAGTPTTGSAATPGSGGAGTLNSITGSSTCYAAGGGAGAWGSTGASVSNGGACGGTVIGGTGSVGNASAGNATANTGSGGGGSGFNDSLSPTSANAGSGSAGVVIIRWTIPGSTGAFPDVSGLTSRFAADNFNTALTSWVDTSGSGYHITTSTNISGTYTLGTTGSNANGSTKSFNVVTGTYQSNMTILSTTNMPAKYTLFTLARYNSTATTSGSTATNDRGRLFQGVTGNWLSGFWAGYSGVAYHEGWLTQYGTDVHVNNWVLGSDCSYDPSPVVNSCNSTYSSNGVQRSLYTTSDTTAHGLAINGNGTYPLEKTNFQIADILVFNRVLTVTEVNLIENYMGNKYGISVGTDVAVSYDPGNSSSYPGSGSTVTDLSGSGVNMTLYNSPTYSASNGGVINFVNTSSQYGQSSSLLRPLSRFTAAVWTKFSTPTPTSDWSAIISAPYNVNNELITPTILYTGTGTAAANQLKVDSGFFDGNSWRTAYNWLGGNYGYKVTTGKWYQIVTTYDGLNVKMYINGALQSTTAATVNSSSYDYLRVATRWDGTPNSVNSFSGSIGTLKIIDHAWSASEVTSEYNSTSARYILDSPNAPTASATTNTVKSIDVAWAAISNATSYTLKLYDSAGSTLLKSITGLTSLSRTITASDYASLANSTSYQVSITAVGDGTVYLDSSESPKTSVTTNAGPVTPTVGTNPTNASVSSGQTATFTVAASRTDSGTLSFQWQYSSNSGSSWNNVASGGTSTSYTTSALTVSNNNYQYRAVVTNTLNGGTATANSSAATVNVGTANSTITISLPGGATSATYNSAVTITASTSVNGSVNFKVGGTTITGCGTVSTSALSATCSWTPSATGSNALTAVFSPTDSSNYTSSTSPTVNVTVGTGPTTTSIVVDAGQPEFLVTKNITATASVAGTVNFMFEGKTIPGCFARPTNGSLVATCSWKPAVRTTVTLTATLSPTSSSYAPSTSAGVVVTVKARTGTRTP